MSELSELWSEIHEIKREQTRLQTVVDGQLASRDWVRQIVEPIQKTTEKIERAVEMMGRDNQALTAAHNKLLEERSQREKAEHEAKIEALKSQTWSAIVKEKWQPLGAFIVAVSAILTVLGHLFSIYVAHVMK